MRRSILLPIVLIGAATAAPSAARAPLSAAAARDLIDVTDDALELAVTFTSRDVELKRTGLLRQVWFDVFLRAFADKKTGRTRYQVYASDTYRSQLWTHWALANYETADGPQQVRLTRIAQVRGTCSRGAGCMRNETVGFPVPEAVLRGAVRNGAAWSFKLKGLDGNDRVETLSVAEIGGMLSAVDRWRAAQGFAAQ